MTSEAFVSVVTPFHDSEPYLAECIESVLAQTHRNFEYVLLDNASTDRGGAIAAHYAARDNRIRLLRSDVLRDQVANYNHALRQISPDSRHVKIVQADDWIYPGCLAEMTTLAEAHPVVAVVSSYELRGRDVVGTGLAAERTVISGREACRLHLLDGVFLFGSPTTVMYRADLVRGRDDFFPLGRLHEDTEIIYELLRAHDLGFVHQVLSFTRQQEGSITSAARSYNPIWLDRLILTSRFGADFLTEEERALVLEDDLTRYYDSLARAVYERRGAAYWDYQRRGLATIGGGDGRLNRIDRVRLAKAIVVFAFKAALSPAGALRALRGLSKRG